MFLVLALSPGLKAQIDTVFWFASPWVTPDHADNKPMAFRISSFGQLTTVRIQQPASTYDTTFTIAANSLFSKFLTHLHNAGRVETKPNNTVKNTGFKITSDFPITVVYDFLSSGNNPETYCLTGQNGMGTEFVTPFQNKWASQVFTVGNDNNNDGWDDSDRNHDGIVEQPYQQINIVATAPNTTVWITPKCPVKGGHPAGVTYSVTLNEGQTFTVENAAQNTNTAGRSLSGTIVVSDKDISITVSDDSVNPAPAGCYDLMGEQIVPTDVIGKEYIMNKGNVYRPTGTPSVNVRDYLFVVATENFTTVTLNDGTTTTTILLNQGETYNQDMTQPLMHVIADKNIYLIH
ncbi:MAG TPA: IgGFc-binding protein [Bacteroidia bacterium]